ncbi:hypothetical protein B0H14DRAFT_2997226 [Mycena olivaceomarginata]|nr:hypothetical protein B0H14DRAFT_2997226 [Mycena olivaceomarginata]
MATKALLSALCSRRFDLGRSRHCQVELERSWDWAGLATDTSELESSRVERGRVGWWDRTGTGVTAGDTGAREDDFEGRAHASIRPWCSARIKLRDWVSGYRSEGAEEGTVWRWRARTRPQLGQGSAPLQRTRRPQIFPSYSHHMDEVTPPRARDALGTERGRKAARADRLLESPPPLPSAAPPSTASPSNSLASTANAPPIFQAKEEEYTHLFTRSRSPLRISSFPCFRLCGMSGVWVWDIGRDCTRGSGR